ncbi:MAG: oligosaccharide flippase family protein [Candidatus Omnitrophica bacterium]|nr:oligosaccharide flippase family protein [Candidatus Omnitrophota bacterium]
MNCKYGNKIQKFFLQNYLIKAFASFSSVQILGIFVSFIVLSLYTRNLSPDDYGKITFIMIMVIMLSIIIDSGLNTAFSIRFYKESEMENNKNIYTILVYNFVVLVGFVFVFFLFPALSEKVFRVTMTVHQQLLVFCLILATILGRFYTNFLIIARKPRKYFFVNLYYYLTLIAMSLIFLLILKTGYFAYIYAYLVAHSVLAVIGIGYFLINYRPFSKEMFSGARLVSLLKIGLPLVPNSLLLMLLTYADRYILGMYSGLASVGVYSVGYVFADKIFSAIINPAGQAFTPLGFQTFTKSIPEYKTLLKKIFEGYWLTMEIFVIVYFSFLREIFELIAGKQYLEGYNIISIVIIGVIFWGAASMIGATIVMKEKTDKVFLFTLISVILNIILNFILIPDFGIYGAALATLISYVLYFQLFFIYTQKLVYVPYNIRLIILSGLISLVFLFVLVGLSFAQINIFFRLAAKIIVASVFIFMMHRFFNVMGAVMDVLRLGEK